MLSRRSLPTALPGLALACPAMRGSQHAYVSIVYREHDPGDPRAEEPALKTHGRTVGVSMQLYEVYERCIQRDRRPLRDGKQASTKRYFFKTPHNR
jgi:hypothetical protein